MTSITTPPPPTTMQRMTSSIRTKDPPVIQKLTRLGYRPWKKDWNVLHHLSSFLWRQPSMQSVNPAQHTVWLFDNTAYQRVTTTAKSAPSQPVRRSWHAEVVACVFEKDSRKDISKMVATIADLIGLDGEVGTERETRHRMAERLRPFLYHVVPAHLMMLEIPLPVASASSSTAQTTLIQQIGPTDASGITSQVVHTGNRHITDGTNVQSSLRGWGGAVSMNTVFAGPEGWLVISDIDDTIKYTKTSESTGILRTTFAEEPAPIEGMPELYARIQAAMDPAWFYLSASPYNLYPFLREFITAHFSPGTLVLRDSSWRDISELVKSFTVNTMEYKMSRILKIRRWLPQRRVLCIGDSTQKDPEAYAEIYRKHPDWIQAIWIRKAVDLPHLEEQNSAARFEAAFEGVPRDVWRVFEQPEEVGFLVDLLKTGTV